MTRSTRDSDSGFSREEVVNRFYNRYPRLSRVLSSFRQNPLSGNTLRMLLGGEQEIRRDEQQVRALRTPAMWQENAPIVISQFASYGSSQLPQFWNATLPDVKDRYGGIARYEHHDVPEFSPSATEYKLATIGRAIQHQAGTEAFWVWFDAVMVQGVSGVNDAYDLLSDLSIEVDQEYLENAVQYDWYSPVLWNDVNSLLGRSGHDSPAAIENELANNEPIFMVFVNGHQVQPSYDAIVGVIEELRSTQPGNSQE